MLDLYGFVDSVHVTALAQPYRVFDSRPGGLAPGSTTSLTITNTGTAPNATPVAAVGTIGSLSDINPNAQGNCGPSRRGPRCPTPRPSPTIPTRSGRTWAWWRSAPAREPSASTATVPPPTRPTTPAPTSADAVGNLRLGRRRQLEGGHEAGADHGAASHWRRADLSVRSTRA